MPDSALPAHLRGKNHWDWPTLFTIKWRGRKIEVGFKWVPRGWTAFAWGCPELVMGRLRETDYTHWAIRGDRPNFEGFRQLRGGVWVPKPITSRGTWQISRFKSAPWWAWPAVFISWSGSKVGKDGKFRNLRVGPRWDDVDAYTNWSWPLSALALSVIAVLAHFVTPWLLLLVPLGFIPSSRRYTGGNEQDTST